MKNPPYITIGVIFVACVILGSIYGYQIGVVDGRGQMQREAIQRHYGFWAGDCFMWRESHRIPNGQRVMDFWQVEKQTFPVNQ